MSEHKKVPRKNYFINKRFQSYFIIRFSLGIFLSTVLLGAILYYSSVSGTTIVFKDLRLQLIPTNEYLLPSLTMALFLAVFITSSLSLVLGLMYSHRIAGPMYRFEKIFKNIVLGDLNQRATLRLHDEWKETSEQLDNALISLRGKMNNLNGEFQDLKKMLKTSDEEIVKKIDSVEQSIQQFKF